MKCLIVDDEPIAIKVIQEHLSKISFLELVGSTTSALEALEILNKEKVDLLFLDIQLPELTGFEVLTILQNPPAVIFTTAYTDYAIESYNFDAIDYLMKPITFERLLKAVLKAQKRSQTSTNSSPIITKETSSQHQFIFVKTEYRTVKIDFDDILFIESLRGYVKFNLKNGEITSLLSIQSIEEKLPKDKFLRIHRSFIIAIDKVNEIERNTVIINQQRLQVGTNFREAFKQVIADNRI